MQLRPQVQCESIEAQVEDGLPECSNGFTSMTSRLCRSDGPRQGADLPPPPAGRYWKDLD
eukprot:6774569-Prorocentrum_lima.AAC.1